MLTKERELNVLNVKLVIIATKPRGKGLRTTMYVAERSGVRVDGDNFWKISMTPQLRMMCVATTAS